MILTNYVIQKQNANFIQVDAAGNKRHGPLSFFSSFSVHNSKLYSFYHLIASFIAPSEVAITIPIL